LKPRGAFITVADYEDVIIALLGNFDHGQIKMAGEYLRLIDYNK
jgi:hypothetical protein